MRRVLVAVLATALALAGAGCTSAPEEQPRVDVTGGAGEEPTLEYTAPLTIPDARSEVVWEGTGPELEDGGPVLLDYRLERADDASLVDETYSSVPKPYTLTPEVISEDLYDALRGQTVGTRLMLLVPATSDTSSFASVMVVDVLPTRAWGEPVEPREGLPVVTRTDDGEPVIAAPAGEPPTSLVVQVLLKGDGEQVVEGSTVTVQYAGVRWSDGSAYDSSWAPQSGPESFDLGAGVLPGLAEGLLEQTVGSQVLLVIPPGSGGAVGGEQDTLVLVVDLLAVAAPAGPTTEEG